MASFRTEGVAFVTGSAKGIGQGIANALAEAGAIGIVFSDVDEVGAQAAAEASKKLATHPSYECQAFYIDVSDARIVQDVVKKAVERFGRIDYLVNSAGVDTAVYAPIPENDMDDFDRVLAINSKGILLCTREVVKIMENQKAQTLETKSGSKRDLGRGAIVNVTSALSYCAVTGKVAYVTSKHAALGVTKSTAQDLKGKGIRVNAMCPSWVRTPMFESESKKAPPVQDFIKGTIGRPAEPDEVGECVVYLCSPAASYVNGIGLIADAGLTLTVHMGI